MGAITKIIKVVYKNTNKKLRYRKYNNILRERRKS